MAGSPGWLLPGRCARRARQSTVLEGSPRIGGKLAVSPVGGIDVDAGAEALLARRPEGVALITSLGLAGQLREPGTTTAGIWTRGEIRPLPRRQFLGVPADLDELAATGLLSPAGLSRARQDTDLPATPEAAAGAPDVSVTEGVGRRLGQELVDRVVEPLLGGVYAGRCEDLSFQATLGPLAAAAPRFRSLSAAAASLLPPGPPAASPVAPASPVEPAPRPVFTTLAGGLGSLPPRLAAASGAEIRIRATVRELTRTAAGWRLTFGSAHAPQWLDADAVILALPARPASRLLGGVPGAADAATALAGDPLRQHGRDHPGLPGGGLPRAAGRQRVPGPGRRRARRQGGDLQHRQVAAPARRRTGPR